MELKEDGFEILSGIIPDVVREELISEIANLPAQGAGSRDLLNQPWCRDLAHRIQAERRMAKLLPLGALAVQCTYFDKSEQSNWLVAYHQDLFIPVSARVESAGCSGWSVKQGVTFVQPPLPVLESLVAVRVHLDESHEGNGPLRVLAASHRYGRIKSSDIPTLREKHREVVCVVPRGGALAFKPLLLHASSKSREPSARRVLQFLFGPTSLPNGLAWHAANQPGVPTDVSASAASPLQQSRS